MAPRGVSAWRRPYTSIYNDNYRYGNSLYSDTLSDIEKRYSDSISKTQLRSDRPDLGFSTFSSSTFASSPTPGAYESTRESARHLRSPSPVRDFRGATFESRLSSALHSSYADEDLVDIKEKAETKGRKGREGRESSRPRSLCLYDDASFWTLPKTTTTTTTSETKTVDFDSSASNRRKLLGRQTSTNGPRSAAWKDKSQELQGQVDVLETSMSDSSSRLKSELSTLKNKYHCDILDLNSSVEQSSQQSSELQRTVKRQANQLMELQSAYDDVQRNLQSTLGEMESWQNKCKTLKKEMEKLREEVEIAVLKSNSASKV